MRDYEGVNYYITIPAQVLHDNRLTPLSRLIYGELSALANIHGYAWINNNGLANRYEVSKYTISRSVSEIEKLGYIKSELVYKEGKKEVEKRNVYILPIDEKRNTLLTKNAIPYCGKPQYPIAENRKDNNTLNNTLNNTTNNTTNKDNEQTSLPDSLEARFNDLWSIYPRKEGRKQALAAYKRAVKKKVSDETIKSGIEKYTAEITANSTGRKFIKQGSTFFNGEHWNDDYQVQQVNNNFIDDELDLPF